MSDGGWGGSSPRKDFWFFGTELQNWLKEPGKQRKKDLTLNVVKYHHKEIHTYIALISIEYINLSQ